MSERILRGESGYLVGCRGMGKSVFLRQLESEIKKPETDVFMFEAPGPVPTIDAAVQAIADQLVDRSKARGALDDFIGILKDYSKRNKLRDLFDAYLDKAPVDLEHLVLLYDELDGYARWGRPFFNELEDIRKNSGGRIVVFAAGGIGLVALDTLLGSSFFSRLTPEILEPFDIDGLERLAQPFGQGGAPLSAEVLETLRLASGGHVALATFGFQHLWTVEEPSPHDVTRIFEQFRNKHTKFLDSVRDPIFDQEISDAPVRVWREFLGSGGRMTQKQLRELVRGASGKQRIREQWVFDMLRSTGLIRCSDGAFRQPNIQVDIIPSILTLDVQDPRDSKGSLREQLVADLSEVLTSIHRMSPDFFRSEEKGKKQIVPEAVFSASLVLGLEPRGWKVEREAQSAAGRTDIKARHTSFGERWVVIEVKLWGHKYEDIHAQVVSYWSDGVEALATVMVGDIQAPDWPDTYKSDCLEGKAPRYERKDPPAAVAGHFIARTSGCSVEEVDHFLLRLAKRRS
ncbi:AAA family ATPase [Sorangium sp. So ce327]|uniref:AAA family ATPase n=1 Tax=Sorangium sp. So ce327 TaxID=3133301 RepID=UPI003F623FD7